MGRWTVGSFMHQFSPFDLCSFAIHTRLPLSSSLPYTFRKSNKKPVGFQQNMFRSLKYAFNRNHSTCPPLAWITALRLLGYASTAATQSILRNSSPSILHRTLEGFNALCPKRKHSAPRYPISLVHHIEMLQTHWSIIRGNEVAMMATTPLLRLRRHARRGTVLLESTLSLL